MHMGHAGSFEDPRALAGSKRARVVRSGATDQDVLAACGLFGSAIAVSTSDTKVTSSHCAASVPSSWRLRMKIGTPSWWSTPQKSAGSTVPRPHTIAR